MMSESSYRIGQLLFTLVFFALVLFFSLKPGQIVVWIGKVINPIFLAFLAILIVVAMVHPGAHISEVEPVADYQTGALFHGFIEGYGTMDAIAGLVFGIVVIRIVRDLDVKEDRAVARETLKAGVGAGALMALVYIFTIIMGAQSRGLFEVSDNGGIALTQISGHYLGSAGRLILAITISFACLKTAIGLVTSCSEMFEKMFPGKLTYRGWAVAFTLFSFAISNVGLTAIIAYAVPVLMLLYPLATVLIIMALTEKLFGGSKYVYRWVTLGAFIPAVFDFCKTLPEGIQTVMNIPALTSLGSKLFPFFDLGLGWIVPSFIGLAIGVIMMKTRGKGQGV